MTKDKYLDYLSLNYTDLLEAFIESDFKVKEQFDEFCFRRWQEEESGYADYIYEQYKDRNLDV